VSRKLKAGADAPPPRLCPRGFWPVLTSILSRMAMLERRLAVIAQREARI